MSKSESLKEYWSGYRNAKIYAYLWAREHYGELLAAVEADGKSDQFRTGFQAGMEAVSIELSALIDKDAELDRAMG